MNDTVLEMQEEMASKAGAHADKLGSVTSTLEDSWAEDNWMRNAMKSWTNIMSERNPVICLCQFEESIRVVKI